MSLQCLYWVMVVDTYVWVRMHACYVWVEGKFEYKYRSVSVCAKCLWVLCRDPLFMSTDGVWEAVDVSVQYVGGGSAYECTYLRVIGFLCSMRNDKEYLCICCAQCMYCTFVNTHLCVQDGESTAS